MTDNDKQQLKNLWGQRSLHVHPGIVLSKFAEHYNTSVSKVLEAIFPYIKPEEVKTPWNDATRVFPKPNRIVEVKHKNNKWIKGKYHYIVSSDGYHIWDNKQDEILQATEVTHWREV